MDLVDSRPELSSLSEKTPCLRVRPREQSKNYSDTAAIAGESRKIIFQVTQLIQITSWASLTM